MRRFAESIYINVVAFRQNRWTRSDCCLEMEHYSIQTHCHHCAHSRRRRHHQTSSTVLRRLHIGLVSSVRFANPCSCLPCTLPRLPVLLRSRSLGHFVHCERRMSRKIVAWRKAEEREAHMAAADHRHHHLPRIRRHRRHHRRKFGADCEDWG